jgi:5'-nucleotidase
MAVNLENKMVVGISSRALFDLEAENRIYQEQGLQAYLEYQIAHEKDILKPGTAFPLIKALHKLNDSGEQLVEIIIMSKNSADTSLRIFNSIEHYGLDITRAALVGGNDIAPYLTAFKADLFLSADEKDVQEAINSGIAAGLICSNEALEISADEEIDQIRIAFDGDAVLFSDESEFIYKREGLPAFAEHERLNAKNPLPEGPLPSFFIPFPRCRSSLATVYPSERLW